jgi:putative transposase
VGQKHRRKINVLCSLLGYSRQSFYQGLRRLQKEEIEKELVVQQVLNARSVQKKVGTRKLLIHLRPFLVEHGISLGRDRLFDLLAEHRLLIRRRTRRIPKTTFSDHWMHKYPNLIRGLVPDAAHRIWVSDITYICHGSGKHAYLSLVTDAYSRKVIGHHLNMDLSAEGCLKALKKALKQLPAGSAPIHHSDRGCQYCSFDYVGTLKSNNIAISMTQSGDPLENAIAERINGILKNELLDEAFPDFASARKAIDMAVMVYNNIRLHSSIDMLTPGQAHLQEGELKRHWKMYYRSRRKEVDMKEG